MLFETNETLACVEKHLVGTGKHMDRVRALAEALPFLPHVRALRLRDNRLTDKGLAPLVGAACQLSSLRRLELGQNVLGTHGANALLKLLDDGGCPLEVSACVAPFSDAHF